MLQEMLDKQNKLQERLGYDIGSMHDEERSAFIKENSIHLTQELHELLYEIPHFKPWKDYSGMSLFDLYESWYKASKELIDMLHFFLNICLALGLNADNLYDMYIAKNKENHRRQDEGYTYDKSYR